jgi:uncharacterized membrane protein YjfL (UPF0719 family)
MEDNENFDAISNFSNFTEDDQASLWSRFTGVEYDYPSLMNLVFLVGIFLVAKFIFKHFIMQYKRRGKNIADNISYALSNFSFFVSLAFILTSVGYGDISTSWFDGAIKTLTYAALGILLLITSGLIFDKIVLFKFNLNKEIADGKLASGIVDSGNFLAAALIISSALRWQEFKQTEAMLAILGIYFASQILLSLATFTRVWLFNNKSKKVYFHEEIKKNNLAVAIDFAGKRVGTALAVTAATNLLSYQNSFSLSEVIIEWLGISIILLLILNLLSWLASKIVFWGQDIYKDILKGNVASALGDVAVYISFGIILSNCIY